jgi:periplasmic divalent cation tolerance protein
MSQGTIPHPDLSTNDFAVVTTTVDSAESAATIARTLVNGRFAACVQILPLGSIYRWNEAVEESQEWMLICKIRSADYGAVEAAILDAHHYETPEILAMPILQGFQPYLDWIKASTTRHEEEA